MHKDSPIQCWLSKAGVGTGYMEVPSTLTTVKCALVELLPAGEDSFKKHGYDTLLYPPVPKLAGAQSASCPATSLLPPLTHGGWISETDK